MADSISLRWIYASNKNHVALTTIMSEDSINKEDDLQQDIGDAADNSEIILDETGETMKPGPRGMANKLKNPNITTELEKENIESDDK